MKARRIVFALSLALLLAVATTAGSVWHHHNSTTAESTCPICHLGHQPAQQPIVTQSAPVLLAVGPQTPLADPVLHAGPVVPVVPGRAPPSL
ncbi:MAG TPA: hypothetical protein VGS59_01665 [Candidatus Acidoferrales bacterium]|nr:hypothetical protein [Candidatus Acidoferrales bacterium]